jgi:hypothetical protein
MKYYTGPQTYMNSACSMHGGNWWYDKLLAENMVILGIDGELF